MKIPVIAIALLTVGLASPVFAQQPPYVFNLKLVYQESKPTGQRNVCGYAYTYSNGATYLVVIEAPTVDKSCPKSIRWTEKGRQLGSAENCTYNIDNGTTAIAGYVDRRSNSCWSESLVEWFN